MTGTVTWRDGRAAAWGCALGLAGMRALGATTAGERALALAALAVTAGLFLATLPPDDGDEGGDGCG